MIEIVCSVADCGHHGRMMACHGRSVGVAARTVPHCMLRVQRREPYAYSARIASTGRLNSCPQNWPAYAHEHKRPVLSTPCSTTHAQADNRPDLWLALVSSRASVVHRHCSILRMVADKSQTEKRAHSGQPSRSRKVSCMTPSRSRVWTRRGKAKR